MVRIAITLVLLVLATLVANAEARIALVIANQTYTQPGAQLTNTYRDGELVKAALERVGFKVWVVRDTSSEGALLQAIGEHVQRLAEAGPEAVGFLYYSGHGAADRPDGANYLIPTAAPITHASQLPLMAVRLDRITSTLASAGRMSFVVFDACRNVPLIRGTRDLAFKGLAPVREQNGLLVAFATEPGNLAVDQNHYAKALAEAIVTPGLEAGQVFRRVRLRVRADTGQTQSPEYLDKRDRDFNFVETATSAAQPQMAPVATTTMAQPLVTQAEQAWAIVKDTNDMRTVQAFRHQYGLENPFYDHLAQARIEELNKQQVAVAVPAAPKFTATAISGLWQYEARCTDGQEQGTFKLHATSATAFTGEYFSSGKNLHGKVTGNQLSFTGRYVLDRVWSGTISSVGAGLRIQGSFTGPTPGSFFGNGNCKFIATKG